MEMVLSWLIRQRFEPIAHRISCPLTPASSNWRRRRDASSSQMSFDFNSSFVFHSHTIFWGFNAAVSTAPALLGPADKVAPVSPASKDEHAAATLSVTHTNHLLHRHSSNAKVSTWVWWQWQLPPVAIEVRFSSPRDGDWSCCVKQDLTWKQISCTSLFILSHCAKVGDVVTFAHVLNACIKFFSAPAYICLADKGKNVNNEYNKI